MELLFGFVAGFATDAFRSVFLPATTGWLSRFVPSARERANIEDNRVTLEIMGQLKALGKDPSLVKHIRDSADAFNAAITNRQDAFVEHAVEVIDSTHMTQIDMNEEAARRAEVARKQMLRAHIALQESGLVTPLEIKMLDAAQERFQEYTEAQGDFARAGFHRGSMAPLAYWRQIESARVNRAGELRQILEKMLEERG